MTQQETIESLWQAMCRQHTTIASQSNEIRKLRMLLSHYQMESDNSAKLVEDLTMENARLRLEGLK